MKRIILIVSAITLFTLYGHAQKGSNNLGIKFGPNLGWASAATDAGKSNGAQLGFSVGGFVDHYFTNYTALSVGLNFNLARMNYQFTDYRLIENFLQYSDVSVNRKYKGSYLEVPVKLKARVEIVDSWKAFVEAGAGVGINLTARGKDSYDFYGTHFADTKYINCFDDYRLLQASLHFGLGAEYEFNSRMNVFAQLTFRHALSNMFTQQLYQQTGSNLKANYIGLEVGILL